jgi:hypothetical protein
MMLDDEEFEGAVSKLEPCGICGVEHNREALKRFEGGLACYRCRGTQADFEDEEEDEESDDADELDFEE